MYSWQKGSCVIRYHIFICLIRMSNIGMNSFYGGKSVTVHTGMAGVQHHMLLLCMKSSQTKVDSAGRSGNKICRMGDLK